MYKCLSYFLLIALGISCSGNINDLLTNGDASPRVSNESLSDKSSSEIGNAPQAGPSGCEVPSAPVLGPAISPGSTKSSDIGPVSTPLSDNKDIEISGWVDTNTDHLSTFAADVDTGSYTHARAKINAKERPASKEIRVEEFVNYFPYNYPKPLSDDVFSVTLDSAPSPFMEDAIILRVGIKGKELENEQRKKVNLVFLTDVSGSMTGPTRLDLAKSAMETLVNNLKDNDQIAIVTYASSSKVVLPLTPIGNRAAIVDGIYSLEAGGSTAMSDGLNLAYIEAEKGLDQDSITRVVVLSDGDANVGHTSHEEILATIKEKVNKGIYLTTVGFGLGNYRDNMMEQLANKGNGNHYYADSLTEARRIFEAEVVGTLDVIAKDLKIQVDFDTTKVAKYRLLGYENRNIADNDFRNDAIDAGELGPGHRVTAFYELKLNGSAQDGLATVRLRYKDPNNDEVLEKEYGYLSQNNYNSLKSAPHDFRLGLIAASFAEVLRASPYLGNVNIKGIEDEFTSFIYEDSAIENELLGLIKKTGTIN